MFVYFAPRDYFIMEIVLKSVLKNTSPLMEFAKVVCKIVNLAKIVIHATNVHLHTCIKINAY